MSLQLKQFAHRAMRWTLAYVLPFHNCPVRNRGFYVSTPWAVSGFRFAASTFHGSRVFLTSGWSHLTKAEERSKSIGMTKGFTMFLGAAEVAGAVGLTFGVLTPPAAVGLILIMLGAIGKKIFCVAYGTLGRKEFGVAL